MKPEKALNFAGAALGMLMALNGWSSSELAKAAGVSRSTIWRYQLGRLRLTREKLRYLAGVMGLPAFAADELFVSMRESLGAHGTATESAQPSGEPPARAVQPLRPGRDDGAEERRMARILRTRFDLFEARMHHAFIREIPEYQSWALCELLCADSFDMTYVDPGKALELADLALAVARVCQGDDRWRYRVLEYAWEHMANARRATGDLAGALEAFLSSQELFRAGAAAFPGPLNAACGLHVEALLRRDQGRYGEALELLKRAEHIASPAELPAVMADKLPLLVASGDDIPPFDDLQEATRLLATISNRPLLALRLGTVLLTALADLKADKDVFITPTFKPLLGVIKELAEKLCDPKTAVSLLWLEGRLATFEGQTARAADLFSRARTQALSRGLVAEAALAALELAVLRLGAGAAVAAEDFVPFQDAEALAPAARSLFRLFQKLALKGKLTPASARSFLADFRRFQNSPH
jgi:transcriptional regulator with XRE-family HTH domain/tetratricopeptide (TPR) repeat protein